MFSVDEYGVQKEGQEESKIQREIEIVEVERVVKEEFAEGLNNKCDGNKIVVVSKESC